jgi:hypothetical protein
VASCTRQRPNFEITVIVLPPLLTKTNGNPYQKGKTFKFFLEQTMEAQRRR